jgi:uncharacterized protein (DUF488 family)
VPGTVYTIGHSTRALDDFLAILAAHGIRGVTDVRRHPSRRSCRPARPDRPASVSRHLAPHRATR